MCIVGRALNFVEGRPAGTLRRCASLMCIFDQPWRVRMRCCKHTAPRTRCADQQNQQNSVTAGSLSTSAGGALCVRVHALRTCATLQCDISCCAGNRFGRRCNAQPRHADLAESCTEHGNGGL